MSNSSNKNIFLGKLIKVFRFLIYTMPNINRNDNPLKNVTIGENFRVK